MLTREFAEHLAEDIEQYGRYIRGKILQGQLTAFLMQECKNLMLNNGDIIRTNTKVYESKESA